MLFVGIAPDWTEVAGTEVSRIERVESFQLCLLCSPRISYQLSPVQWKDPCQGQVMVAFEERHSCQMQGAGGHQIALLGGDFALVAYCKKSSTKQTGDAR